MSKDRLAMRGERFSNRDAESSIAQITGSVPLNVVNARIAARNLSSTDQDTRLSYLNHSMSSTMADMRPAISQAKAIKMLQKRSITSGSTQNFSRTIKPKEQVKLEVIMTQNDMIDREFKSGANGKRHNIKR